MRGVAWRTANGMHIASSAVGSLHAFCRREVVLTGNLSLNIRRRDTRDQRIKEAVANGLDFKN